MFSNIINQWLEAALDSGILEWDFWQMTFAEVERAIESKNRVREAEERRKASFDYVLADLIGRSVSRIYNSSNVMPEISKAYPGLFNQEEVEQQIQAQKAELSALRFKQFVQFHNKKLKEVDELTNE